MLKKALLVSVSAGFLSACASTWDVEGVKGLVPQGDAFQQALFGEYVALAEAERDRYDWSDTAAFLAKARAAAAGRTVLPDDLGDRDVAVGAAELTAARAQLITALDGGARSAKPQVAARAQGAFECWIEKQEENIEPDGIKLCRDRFEGALAELTPEPAAPAPQPVVEAPKGDYIVFFPVGTDRIDAEAQKVLAVVLDDWRSEKPARVVIAGHTDTIGDTVSNLLLSQKRAEAVAAYLEGKGMPASAMALEAYGEEQPLVKTGDGVRELRNRRVEIVFGDN
ncbi:OmpA family protein [Caenispirillum bisanense]|uniref:OmpA family protein n=1 Tax=Caenispirillum bisanense TaxID=414052 RepID=UPI0031D2A751